MSDQPQVWSRDVMADQLVSGIKVLALTVIELYSTGR